jgi:predicted nucleic acid-binding protein
VVLTTLVLYEWLRGPRAPAELAAQQALFPRELMPVFGVEEAERAAQIYRSLSRPRGRETDIAIAACAIVLDATLWTLNTRDFGDIPGLDVSRPALPRL